MKLHIQRSKNRQITFRLTNQVYLKIKELSLKENVSMPEICRALIDRALKNTRTNIDVKEK